MHIKPVRTHKVSDNIYVIRTLISNFYIYTDGENTICFDTGYKPFIIRRALNKLNILPECVSNIFLTHSDYDHVGGIGLFNKSDIYISSDEVQMITYKKPRLLLLFNKRLKREYKTLNDGDIINIGNIKVKALTTPGHTPGSMSYLVNDSILFTGDTLSLKDGSIKPFFWLQNMNTKLQKVSIKKLLEIDNIDFICTGHSGYLKNDKQA